MSKRWEKRVTPYVPYLDNFFYNIALCCAALCCAATCYLQVSSA